MSALNPKDLGKKVTTRDFNWLDLCMRAWGADFNAPDHDIYQMSNGRRFDSTDKYLTGVYGVPVFDVITQDNNYMDMQPGLAMSGLSATEEIEIALEVGPAVAAVTWVNNARRTVTWTNATGATVDFTP